MKTSHLPYTSDYSYAPKENSLTHQFIDWCKSQEQYRFGWLAVILAGHGCFITPITLFFVMIAGNSPLLWAFAIAAMTMCLVTNLAALPTKITIPIFFLSIIIDMLLVASCAGGLLSLFA
jgi:hypothetical protein